jgi:hypothetical protein
MMMGDTLDHCGANIDRHNSAKPFAVLLVQEPVSVSLQNERRSSFQPFHPETQSVSCATDPFDL